MNWIFCDLDSTLIDTRELIIRGDPEPKIGTPEHQQWVETVTKSQELLEAKPIRAVLHLINCAIQSDEIVFLTNRNEKLRAVTEQWLQRYVISPKDSKGYWLKMKPNGLVSTAGKFKEAVIQGIIKTSESVLVIDDDPDGSLEEACLSNSWTLLKTVNF